jgi:hypothetical protein
MSLSAESVPPELIVKLAAFIVVPVPLLVSPVGSISKISVPPF